MFLQVHPSIGGKIDSFNYRGKLSNFGIYVVCEFLNLKNTKQVISANSGVTWVLGISLMATTGPVKNSILSKGKAEEISLEKLQITSK